MELTTQEKNAIIDRRIKTYLIRTYEAELNLTALKASNAGPEQITAQEKDIANLRAAVVAIEAMRGGEAHADS